MDPTIAERLARISGDLPAMPAVVLRVLEMAQDTDTTVDDLKRVVEVDPGLTTKLLRVANSAYYRRAREVVSIDHAILTLGFRTVLSLALASSTKQVFDQCGDVSPRVRRTLWEHSISTAFVAADLGRFARNPAIDTELCFVGGLLHDIGKLVILRHFPGPFARIGREANDAASGLRAEDELLGFRHDALGAHLAAAWELPEPLVRVIGKHHDAPAAEANRAETAIIALADHVATQAGWNFFPAQAATWENAPGLAELGFGAEALQERMTEVRTHVEELKGIL